MESNIKKLAEKFAIKYAQTAKKEPKAAPGSHLVFEPDPLFKNKPSPGEPVTQDLARPQFESPARVDVKSIRDVLDYLIHTIKKAKELPLENLETLKKQIDNNQLPPDQIWTLYKKYTMDMKSFLDVAEFTKGMVNRRKL